MKSAAELDRLRWGLVVLAVVLSVFNGVMSLMTVMIFSDHERAALWWAMVLPAFLWIPAAASGRFPRAGLALFAMLLFGAVMVEKPEWPPCIECIGLLRFSVLGGVLLVLNVMLWFKSRSMTPKESITGISRARFRFILCYGILMVGVPACMVLAFAAYLGKHPSPDHTWRIVLDAELWWEVGWYLHITVPIGWLVGAGFWKLFR